MTITTFWLSFQFGYSDIRQNNAIGSDHKAHLLSLLLPLLSVRVPARDLQPGVGNGQDTEEARIVRRCLILPWEDYLLGCGRTRTSDCALRITLMRMLQRGLCSAGTERENTGSVGAPTGAVIGGWGWVWGGAVSANQSLLSSCQGG